MLRAPGRSSRVRSVLAGAGTRLRSAAASSPAPSGMLTNSTHRQLSSAVSTPPRTTPTRPAAPPMMLHRVRARCRWCSSAWLAVMRLRLVGASAAAPVALDDPGREQHRRIGRQAAGQAGDGEDDRAEEEHPLAAEEVAGPGGQQQETAEGEQVAADDPLLLAGRQVKSGPHLRQGQGHDGGVEHDHELRQAGHGHHDAEWQMGSKDGRGSRRGSGCRRRSLPFRMSSWDRCCRHGGGMSSCDGSDFCVIAAATAGRRNTTQGVAENGYARPARAGTGSIASMPSERAPAASAQCSRQLR